MELSDFINITKRMPPLYYRWDLSIDLHEDDRDYIVVGNGFFYPPKGIKVLASVSLPDRFVRLYQHAFQEKITDDNVREAVRLFSAIILECDMYHDEFAVIQENECQMFDVYLKCNDHLLEDLEKQVGMYNWAEIKSQGLGYAPRWSI